MSALSPLADPDRRDPDAVPVPIMLQAAVVALTGGTDSDASGLRLPRKSARRGHEVLRRGCGVAGLTSQDDGALRLVASVFLSARRGGGALLQQSHGEFGYAVQ